MPLSPQPGLRVTVSVAHCTLCVLWFAVSFPASAQTPPPPNEQLNLGVPLQRQIGKTQPEPGDESDSSGLPYSQILRDVEPPYENLFRSVRVGGQAEEKVGPGDLFLQTRLLNGPRFNFPLFARGVRPEDAELKLGKFYVDIRALSGGLLYSDNVNLRQTNSHDGVIGILRLTLAVSFQVTDNARLATYGTLVYLPFRNEVGFAGFGVDDPFAQFESGPVWQTQLSYEFKAVGWEFETVDDFRIRHRRFGAVASFDLFNGESFDEEDRAGRYVFRDRTPPAPGSRPINNNFGLEFFEMRNLIGATAHRLLPTDTRMEIGAYHSDYWYSNTRADLLPASRDSVYAALISERETLRFKPFIRYRASRLDSNEFSQEARAGMRGPITENLQLIADAGYFRGGNSVRETYLARVRLRHEPGPLTFQQLEYNRGITEPDFDLEQSWLYLIRHVLGPDFYGEFYGFKSEFQDLRGTGRGGDDWRTALRFTYNFSRSMTLRASGTYVNTNYKSTELADWDAWLARAELFYRFTRSFHSRLIYQYQIRDSTEPGKSYNENLVTLHFVKYF